MELQDTAVWIQGVATAVPRHEYSQEFAREFMKRVPLYGEKERRFIDRVYADTGIERRHSVIADYDRPPEQFEFFSRDESMLPEPSSSKRNDLYIGAAAELAEEAVTRLAEEQALDLGSITHLVTVSCTGFSAPGFDYHLVRALGLPASVFRQHIGFMGCYAAFPALRAAHSICLADKTARVLVVDVELCSLHFQFKPELDTIVANSLFADGAAAALISRDPSAGAGTDLPVPPGRRRYRIDGFSSRIIPGSADAMSWRLGDTAFDMRLSSYVPRLIQENIGDVVRTTMNAVSLDPETVAFWAIHPGGRAILDRVRQTLDLAEERLDASYRTLRDYGNMSSATIFFVLQRMRDDSRGGTVFAAAFGPGLTVESARLEKVVS